MVPPLPSAFPSHWGLSFTPTIHTKLSPSTDPTKVTLPPNFTVLVTGAGKGLGAETAFAYAKAGASAIIIVARTSSDLESVSKQITAISPTTKVLCIPCDVTNESQVQALAKQVEQTFHRLDVLVNNAGTTTPWLPDPEVAGGKRLPYGILEGSSEDFQKVFNLNFFGTYLAIRYLMPLMIATEGGAKAIINIVSVAAQLAGSYLTPIAYNVSKQAVVRLTEHVDEAHRVDGIVCYALHPGSVITPLSKGAPPIWDQILVDDIDLCGGFCVWLTKERREYLSGRYVMCNWDIEELEGLKNDIVEKQKLKFTMDV